MGGGGSVWGQAIEFLIIRVLARLFPNRYRVIPRVQDGAPLLRQFKICRWAYLQSFVNVEHPDWFHVHRWQRMISFVLSGRFREERYPGSLARFFKTHSAPSVYMMDRSVMHRLDAADPCTWTLFFMFGDRKAWGYFPRPSSVDYVPWDQFIPEERKVRSL